MVCIVLLFPLTGMCIFVDILERAFSWTLPFLDSFYAFTVRFPAFRRFLRRIYFCFFSYGRMTAKIAHCAVGFTGSMRHFLYYSFRDDPFRILLSYSKGQILYNVHQECRSQTPSVQPRPVQESRLSLTHPGAGMSPFPGQPSPQTDSPTCFSGVWLLLATGSSSLSTPSTGWFCHIPFSFGDLADSLFHSSSPFPGPLPRSPGTQSQSSGNKMIELSSLPLNPVLCHCTAFFLTPHMASFSASPSPPLGAFF